MHWVMIFISGFFPVVWLLTLLATRRWQGKVAVTHERQRRSTR